MPNLECGGGGISLQHHLAFTSRQVQVQLMPDEGAVVVDVGVDQSFADENRALLGPDKHLNQVVVVRTLNQPEN